MTLYLTHFAIRMLISISNAIIFILLFFKFSWQFGGKCFFHWFRRKLCIQKKTMLHFHYPQTFNSINLVFSSILLHSVVVFLLLNYQLISSWLHLDLSLLDEIKWNWFLSTFCRSSPTPYSCLLVYRSLFSCTKSHTYLFTAS